MSLVENILNQISTKELGGITKPYGLNLNDDTFEKLLQKGLNTSPVEAQNNITGNLGVPAGMIIEPFDGTTVNNPIQVQQIQNNNESVEIKDVDMGNDYFSNLLQKSPNEHKSILNFAQKHAAIAYNVFGKGFVENLTDLASDITSLIK